VAGEEVAIASLEGDALADGWDIELWDHDGLFKPRHVSREHSGRGRDPAEELTDGGPVFEACCQRVWCSVRFDE